MIMLKGLVCFLAATSAFAAVSASRAPRLPADVSKFVERRDTCDHFRGEESEDPARQTEIVAGLQTYCKGTDRELAGLRSKYKTNKAVIKKLSGYDANVE